MPPQPWTTQSATQSAPPPMFKAVANSTKPIFQMLKCISFANKVQVQIIEEGLRVCADNSRVMHGVVMLHHSLFTSYQLIPDAPPSLTGSEEQADATPSFQVSLPSFLETLQILGSVDSASRAAKTEQDFRTVARNYRTEAFSNQALGIAGTCCLTYPRYGAPFSVIIDESGVKTTADLTTYESEMPEEIPFDRQDIVFKIIMPPRYLLDALNEVATMGPGKLGLTALPKAPWLVLSGRGGDLGTSSYDFAKGRDLIESLAVREEWQQTYKFELVRAAADAMRLSNKVSVRGDGQGVLSMQFMVEVEGAETSFMEFRFVPFLGHEEGETDDDYENESENE